MRIQSIAKMGLAVAALMSLNAAAAHAQIGETYYIPMPSTQVKIWADTQTNLAENDNLLSGIGITVTAPDTVIYWDHWEDGFEFEITDPASPGHRPGCRGLGRPGLRQRLPAGHRRALLLCPRPLRRRRRPDPHLGRPRSRRPRRS